MWVLSWYYMEHLNCCCRRVLNFPHTRDDINDNGVWNIKMSFSTSCAHCACVLMVINYCILVWQGFVETSPDRNHLEAFPQNSDTSITTTLARIERLGSSKVYELTNTIITQKPTSLHNWHPSSCCLKLKKRNQC